MCAGVGYSYTTEGSSDCKFGVGVTVNDNSTAEMNHLFLRRFFDVYPQFAGNELFLSGESCEPSAALSASQPRAL